MPSHEGCRLPLTIGFLPLPVDPIQMAMACSLRSTSITLASSLLRSSPPLTGASVLSALRLAPLVPFPLASPCRFSRSVQEPSRASRRLHAGCRSGSLRHPPSLSRSMGQPPVLTSPNLISTLPQRFACARLSRPCLPGSCPDVSATLPSRPGEFHPEPLTDPDVTLSCHPARATARRLPPSVENLSSSRYRLALSQRR